MTVTTAFQGELGSKFTLMDLGYDFLGVQSGINWLSSIDGGAFIPGSITSVSLDDEHKPIEAPSPFKDFLKVQKTTVSSSPDLGFAWAFGLMNNTQSTPTLGNTNMPIHQYTRIGVSPNGCLVLALNPTNTDVSATMTTKAFGSGVLIEQISDNYYYFGAFFSNNGGCYFFFDVLVGSKIGKLLNIPPNSVALNYIGELQPLRAYYLTDSPYQIKGTVTDAAGMPAAGRVVAAFDRVSQTPVGSAISQHDGTYQMGVTAKSGASLFLVCLDDDAPPNFEAQIVDRVLIQ